jgi:Family of unknown function (DUF6445)
MKLSLLTISGSTGTVNLSWGIRATIQVYYQKTSPCLSSLGQSVRRLSCFEEMKNNSHFVLFSYCSGRIALTRNQRKPIKLVVHHYISHWNGNGGTAFYLDRATNRSHFSDPECRQLIKQVKRKKKPPTPGQKRNPCAEAGCHCKVEGITPKYCKKQCEIRGQQTGYLGNQSEFYTTAYHVPYQFDRAVIFSPLLLHSAFLEEEDVVRLSCDPAKGRLVATFYVV